MRADLNTAHSQRIQAEAQLSSLENGDPSAPNSALSAAADEIVAGDPQLTALKTSLGQKRSELLGTLAGLTPNNPLRKQTEEQLADTEAALQKMQTSLRAKGSGPPRREASRRGESRGHGRSPGCCTICNSRRMQPPPLLRNSNAPTRSRPTSNACRRATTRSTNVSAISSSRAARRDQCICSSRHEHRLAPQPSKTHKYLLMLFPISILWESRRQYSSTCWIRISTPGRCRSRDGLLPDRCAA